MKGAYGRVDAPFLWFQEMKRGLEGLGFVPCPFDPCAFILKCPKTHAAEGIIGLRVDDGLCCGSPRFQAKLEELSRKFPFGSHRKKNFTFTGLKIEQQDDFSIHVSQSQYVKDIQPITVPRHRRQNPGDVVTESERQALRAVIGSLQYAAVNTRPDLCSRLSWLQSKINVAKVETLLEANRTLQEAKQHSEVMVKVQPIDLSELRFVAFSDASFSSPKFRAPNKVCSSCLVTVVSQRTKPAQSIQCCGIPNASRESVSVRWLPKHVLLLEL